MCEGVIWFSTHFSQLPMFSRINLAYILKSFTHIKMLPKKILCPLPWNIICENCEGTTIHAMKEESLNSTSVQKPKYIYFPLRRPGAFIFSYFALYYFIPPLSPIYLTPYLLRFFGSLFNLLFYIDIPLGIVKSSSVY